MVEGPYKYWAFISYSHRDQAWAEWLHKALESYRVPRRLVGRATAGGTIPRRLFPVFRDSEELPSSPNLSAVIDEALQQSRFLIVIASPYAAVSRWVDEEIQRFRALGRADRILCLIVDGEPHADTLPQNGLLECFPPALREPGCAEPVGADVRQRKDSKAAAKLRLIAGLLGVGLDDLRRRERRRQLLRTTAWSVAAALALIAFVGIWNVQTRARQEALAQQALHAHIDTLYEKGRRELQVRNEARAAVYLNEAYRLGRDTPALRFMLGRAMRVVDALKFTINVGASVEGLSFSPDATRVLTLDVDHHAAVWELASGRKQWTAELPEDVEANPKYSADGSKLLFRIDGQAPRLRVIDAATGVPVADLSIAPHAWPAHTQFDHSGDNIAFVQPDGQAAIYNFAAARVVHLVQRDCVLAGYSRDGGQLLTADAHGVVRSYDARSLRLRHVFESLGAQVVYTDSSPDGRLLAAGAISGVFRLWEADSGRARISAAHASDYLGHVFNGIDGTRLLTASVDSARVWDTRSGALLDSIKFGSNDQRIHISEDGRRLINTGAARLSVLDVDTGADLFSLDTHFGGATAIDFSFDDQLLATAGRDGVVAFWQLPAMPLASFQHGSGPEDPNVPRVLAAVSSDFASHRELGFSAGLDGRVDWWNSRTLATLHDVAADIGRISAGALSADGKQIAVGGVAALKVWDVDSANLQTTISNIGATVRAIHFSRDGRMLAAALRGGTSMLWQLPEGQLLKSQPIDRYLAQAFNPVAAQFAIGAGGTVSLWEPAHDRRLWSTPLSTATPADAVTAIDFSRDGRQLLAVSEHGGIYLLDSNDGHVIESARDETSESVTTAVLNPQGTQVLLSDDNRCAFLLRLQDKISHRLCGHGMDLSAAGFNPAGTLIFTTSRDGSARIWDTDGNLLDVLAFHGGAVTYRNGAFSRDGDRLLTGSVDGSARVWDATAEERDAETIAASLQCRVPWQTDGDDLTPVRPQRTLCGAR